MSAFAPTPEQDAAVTAFETGENMILEAGAGTGKTSTLRLLGAATPDRYGLYLAFNKAVAVEAGQSFPDNVRCSTVHSLAYREIVDPARRQRMGGPRQTSQDAARILGIRGPHRISADRVLAPKQVARLALETVGRFCHSAEDEILARHVPPQVGIDTYEDRAALAVTIVPYARQAWADIRSRGGRLKYQHDYYVKEWQLTHPRLESDFVFVDEAQDSDPVLVDVVNRQRDTQVVAVGDRCQSIYQWRGAVDAMDAFGAVHHLYLTQSFRFGEAIAEEANRWLGVLDAVLRVRGTPSIPSQIVERMEQPTAVLARTNAGALEKAMTLIAAGLKPALVGGGKEISALAQAALELQETGQTWHPDLCVFTSWQQVEDYVEEDFGGQELATMVRLVDNFGAQALIDAANSTVPEERADVVISTAHKAKGREWARVQIADDFRAPGWTADGARKPIVPADAMLAYVAVTRAKVDLDRGSLVWLDVWLEDRDSRRVSAAW